MESDSVRYDAIRRDRCVMRQDMLADWRITGIKEYSDWQTIPQLYISQEFVGGTDILMSMHQDGSLSKLLEEKDVLVPAEGE